jgi:hypothetical protein
MAGPASTAVVLLVVGHRRVHDRAVAVAALGAAVLNTGLTHLNERGRPPMAVQLAPEATFAFRRGTPQADSGHDVHVVTLTPDHGRRTPDEGVGCGGRPGTDPPWRQALPTSAASCAPSSAT